MSVPNDNHGVGSTVSVADARLGPVSSWSDHVRSLLENSGHEFVNTKHSHASSSVPSFLFDSASSSNLYGVSLLNKQQQIFKCEMVMNRSQPVHVSMCGVMTYFV